MILAFPMGPAATGRGLCDIDRVNWGASSRWSFPPISAWGSIETTTMRRMLPTLLFRVRVQ